MATAYARRSFAGGAISTTIPTGMGSGDTSFTLAVSTGWSFANNFYVVVDRGLSTEEKILCSGIASLVVSVASGGRGADGTSAQAHTAGCTVQVCHVAQDDDEANQVVAAVLGQSGAAKGDILYMLSAAGPNTLERIAIGTAGQVLGVSAGVPAWMAPSSAMSLISSSTLGATGSFSFSSIPATYNHLKLIIVARSTYASNEIDGWKIQFNGDTGSNYQEQVLTGATTSAVAGSYGAHAYFGAGAGLFLPGASATANVAGRLEMDIPLYAGTTWQKIVGLRNGFMDIVNTTSYASIEEGLWKNTAAVNAITITGANASLATGSAAYLYGIT